eukprot:1195251-Prorocentrum_minimum.AAC.2
MQCCFREWPYYTCDSFVRNVLVLRSSEYVGFLPSSSAYTVSSRLYNIVRTVLTPIDLTELQRQAELIEEKDIRQGFSYSAITHTHSPTTHIRTAHLKSALMEHIYIAHALLKLCGLSRVSAPTVV